MKRITFIIIALALAWYMGGCGGASNQVSAPSISDLSTFAGTYNLKDHNCTGAPITSFRVNATENTMTILNRGGAQTIRNGDRISLNVRFQESGGTRYISAPDIGCLGLFIENESHLRAILTDTNMDMSINDLLVSCLQEDSDEACLVSFTRNSIN